MLRLLSYSLLLVIVGVTSVMAQGWTPASEGLLQTNQWGGVGGPLTGFDINFKPNGPFGKDWVYGFWLDSDSVVRHVGYREGGKWVSLPISGNYNSYVLDIEQYGDTMYISGAFNYVQSDKDSIILPLAGILKYHNDSVWVEVDKVVNFLDLQASGDTLLLAGGIYLKNDSTVLGPHLITTNGGATWTNPYNNIYPGSGKEFGGGPWDKVKIRGGEIYTLNFDGSNVNDGLIRWDGQQWHTYGPGLYGTYSQVYDFTFFRNQIYIAGSFTRAEDSRNPGELIARWTGTDWQTVGGGSTTGAWSLFEHDNILYCINGGGGFGDANIPFLAGWDGHQWCGTPVVYSGDSPVNFGFINDTLFCVYKYPGKANGVQMSYINYYDGNYLRGPNSICSTKGIGLEEEPAEEPIIQVYPNPAKDVLNVELPEGNETYRYELYSMDGRLLQQGELDATHNQIKVAKGLSGLCVLKVVGEREVVAIKVKVE